MNPNTNIIIKKHLDIQLKISLNGKIYDAITEPEYAKLMKIKHDTLKAYRLRDQTEQKWVKIYGIVFYIVGGEEVGK